MILWIFINIILIIIFNDETYFIDCIITYSLTCFVYDWSRKSNKNTRVFTILSLEWLGTRLNLCFHLGKHANYKTILISSGMESPVTCLGKVHVCLWGGLWLISVPEHGYINNVFYSGRSRLKHVMFLCWSFNGERVRFNQWVNTRYCLM